MKKVYHYRGRCIGCSYCVEVAPEFWTMNEGDGKCDLIGGTSGGKFFVLEVFADEYDKNKRVAAICPTNCIRIE